mgnify:CR=1 FL=1
MIYIKTTFKKFSTMCFPNKIEYNQIKNNFRDDDDTLREQPEQVEPIPTPVEVRDPNYIRWLIFDEIPE